MKHVVLLLMLFLLLLLPINVRAEKVCEAEYDFFAEMYLKIPRFISPDATIKLIESNCSSPVPQKVTALTSTFQLSEPAFGIQGYGQRVDMFYVGNDTYVFAFKQPLKVKFSGLESVKDCMFEVTSKNGRLVIVGDKIHVTGILKIQANHPEDLAPCFELFLPFVG